MRCRWCGGTGGECGCGYGHCAHCGGSGETADPPFGPNEIHDVLTAKDYAGINELSKDIKNGSIWDDRWPIYAEAIRRQLNLEIGLTKEELQKYIDYWNNDVRDETVGDVKNRIALELITKNEGV